MRASTLVRTGAPMTNHISSRLVSINQQPITPHHASPETTPTNHNTLYAHHDTISFRHRGVLNRHHRHPCLCPPTPPRRSRSKQDNNEQDDYITDTKTYNNNNINFTSGCLHYFITIVYTLTSAPLSAAPLPPPSSSVESTSPPANMDKNPSRAWR